MSHEYYTHCIPIVKQKCVVGNLVDWIPCILLYEHSYLLCPSYMRPLYFTFLLTF